MPEDRRISTACPLDCWDACSITATVRDNTVTALKGNPENHGIGRFLCAKGRKHIAMLNHPQRLREPLLKRADRFEQLTWPAALDLLAEKMDRLRMQSPTTGLLHYTHGGNMGILKGMDNRFFMEYGGVTSPIGSLCQGAGAAAQKLDFGGILSHHRADCLNSHTIIIWGRNPAATGIHLIPFLVKARAQGIWVIVVDPLATETLQYADEHIRLRPGTDGALALAIANILITRNLIDEEYIAEKVLGFDQFRDYVRDFTPETASSITGVSVEQIISMAMRYSQKPASIFLGYGLQRYTNSGNAVRAIDALAAITGNIGVSGGGVNYGHEIRGSYVDQEIYVGPSPARAERTFLRPLLAEFIETANDPPVQMIYTARANPINQTQNSARLVRAFANVKFKVTVDLFMTDTAMCSDLVLPCRHFLEDTDIVFSHNYLQYCNPAVRPKPWLPSELWIINQLAGRLGLNKFPVQDEEWWLEQAFQPLLNCSNLSFADLKEKPILLPGTDPIPWQEGFATPSGKYELYSKQALFAGHSPLPEYQASNCRPSEQYPYYLLTPHTKDSINSQHFVLVGQDTIPIVYIHPELGRRHSLGNGDVALVSTETGSLRCQVELDTSMSSEIVKIYQGWWLQNHGGVNVLTRESVSDIGNNAAYYNCFCNLRPESICGLKNSGLVYVN